MKKRIVTILLSGMLFGSCSSDDSSSTSGIPLSGNNGSMEIPNNYSDAQLVETVQKDVLKYFWDYAETNSKLERERYHTDNPSQDANIITTGESGFGLIKVLVGIKNGYISRAEAVSRHTTSINFLQNANCFHGAWLHWGNGINGQVVPFSQYDNSGDLIETDFLTKGLICVREYFKSSSDASELSLSQKADALWKGVEWNWYTKVRMFYTGIGLRIVIFSPIYS